MTCCFQNTILLWVTSCSVAGDQLLEILRYNVMKCPQIVLKLLHGMKPGLKR